MSNKVSIMQEMFKKEGSDELVPAVTNHMKDFH